MAHQNINLLSVAFLLISGSNIFAVLGSICICVYYVSMLKQNVINKSYNRSWKQYFKAWFKRTK